MLFSFFFLLPFAFFCSGFLYSFLACNTISTRDGHSLSSIALFVVIVVAVYSTTHLQSFFFLNGYSLFIYIYQPSAYRPPRSALLYIYIYEQIRTNRQLALVTRCSLLVYPNYYFVPVVISLLCFSFSSSSSSLHHWHTQCQKTKPCIKIWLLFFFQTNIPYRETDGKYGKLFVCCFIYPHTSPPQPSLLPVSTYVRTILFYFFGYNNTRTSHQFFFFKKKPSLLQNRL